MRQGLVAAQAKGIGDGRVTVSVTNRTNRPLRVVLPPGIVAQSATGQMGGMMGGMGGGMGGGMMGGMGGMGGGMMGGGMGGMGGGMMGGMGGGMMGGGARTMPPMMGMMMLANVIMYFCGDFDSWDRRSLMIGMGRMGGMGGGMGGMGGGMGGMGGGMMGGMGGMMSVPPSSLPFADLKPKQTRHLPTRFISMTAPDPQKGLQLPEEGELFRIGDISEVSEDPRVQKALKRLASQTASSRVAQLVMWRLAAGLDWATIAQLSQGWANRYELTLAQDFVERLDLLAEGETGRVHFQIDGTDPAGQKRAAETSQLLQGQLVLGLLAERGIPARPEGPSVAFRVRLKGENALVQVVSSDEAGRKWIPFGKFSVPARSDGGRFEPGTFADSLAEGLLNRLVRMQLLKGPRDKGKLTYRLRIDNASPMLLNGLAVLGTESGKDEKPRVLSGVSISPRRSLTVPASEDVVKNLGLKQGIRIIALDLSGL